MKYPPVMLAVKNPENCNVSYYKGFGAAFIYYFAEHLQLRYKLAILFFMVGKQKINNCFLICWKLGIRSRETIRGG